MSEIEKFEGDMFWDEDDPEMAIEGPEELLDEVGCNTVIAFQQAKSLPTFYGVQFYDEAKDEYVSKFYTTKEEARACMDAHKAEAQP